MINKKFNRRETEFDNYYFQQYGFNKLKNEETYEGYIKCKLVHTLNYSLVVPDLIFLETDENLFWIQPLCFLANQLLKYDEYVSCNLFVDISCGETIQLIFTNKDYIKAYEDGSQFYKCQIRGLKNLHEYATGLAKIIDSVPFVELYHHTLQKYKRSILSTQRFKTSSWNIQGNKKLNKIAYLYLTPLSKIVHDNDLIQIAMSSNGTITLITDRIEVPIMHDANWIIENNENIAFVDVYRESTKNRNKSIQIYVDSTILAPQHIN